MEKDALRALVDRYGRFVPEVDRTLAEAWLAGESQVEIARRTGAVQASVSCRLRRLKERLEHCRSLQLPDFSRKEFLAALAPPLDRQTVEMLSFWYGGNSQSETARKFGLKSNVRFRYLMLQGLKKVDESGRAPEHVRALRLYGKHASKIYSITMRDWS